MSWKVAGLSTISAAIVLGCGGGNGAAPGGERGPCYPNATCNQGLTCLSNFCVRVDVDGASDASGYAGAGGVGPAIDGGGGAGGAVVATDAGFDAAPHARLPQVANLGGPVLAIPKVLPIFYPGDPDTADIKAFLADLARGSYWRSTTSEYGVGALSVLPAVSMASTAASSITDATLQAEIILNTAGGPGTWGAPDPNVIYLFVLPPGIVATLQGWACCTDFGGYHSETNVGGVAVPYAVSCACPGFLGPDWDALDERTGAMSHEIVEAATDPFPTSDPAMQQADQANYVWTLVTQGEVGDMCVVQPDAFIRPTGSNYVVQRSWSNAAAMLGQNPCVPAPKAVPYFNSMPALDLIPLGSNGYQTRGVQIPLGQTRTVDLHLFSAGAVTRDWTVTVYSYEDVFGGGAPSLSFSLDKSAGRNGDVLHLAITAHQTNAQLGADPFIVLSTYGAPGDADYQANLAMGLVTN